MTCVEPGRQHLGLEEYILEIAVAKIQIHLRVVALLRAWDMIVRVPNFLDPSAKQELRNLFESPWTQLQWFYFH